MPWNALAAADVQNYLLPDEQAALQVLQGASNILNAVVVDVAAQVQAEILAAGNQIGPAGTIPDQLKMDVISLVIWRWVTALPNTDLASKQREANRDRAQQVLDDMRAKKFKIEIPTAPQNVAGPDMRVETVRHGNRPQDFNTLGAT